MEIEITIEQLRTLFTFFKSYYVTVDGNKYNINISDIVDVDKIAKELWVMYYVVKIFHGSTTPLFAFKKNNGDYYHIFVKKDTTM